MHYLMPEECKSSGIVRFLPLTAQSNWPMTSTSVTQIRRRSKTCTTSSSSHAERLKKDVIKELPSKTEKILRVEMSAMQTHYYKSEATGHLSGYALTNHRHPHQG